MIMDGDLHGLERTVEREMGLLRGLPDVAPRPECLARVQAAVRAEALRAARRGPLRRWVRVASGVAAAAALVFGWTTCSRATRGPALPDPEAVVAEWAAALDESNYCLRQLTTSGWARGDATRDAAAELDELLQGLDDSFERFEGL